MFHDNRIKVPELIFRTLHNTARVASDTVSRVVVEILAHGGQFLDVKDLVAGVRGRRVFDEGDLTYKKPPTVTVGGSAR
jgi:hypothetical protein